MTPADKLLRQLKRAQRAGRGERIKVKMPRLKPAPTPNPNELVTDILTHERYLGSRLAMRVWGEVPNDARSVAVTHGSVLCGICGRSWSVNSEQIIELRPHLHTVVASPTGRSDPHAPNLQNLPP